MISFTSNGLKSYFMEVGNVDYQVDEERESTFSTTVTETIARSKGLCLTRQNVSGLITKNLMREFLQALADNKTMEISVPQFFFHIESKNYKIKPKEYEKLYSNKRLLQKRMYVPSISLTQTWPIGATEFYSR